MCREKVPRVSEWLRVQLFIDVLILYILSCFPVVISTGICVFWNTLTNVCLSTTTDEVTMEEVGQTTQLRAGELIIIVVVLIMWAGEDKPGIHPTISILLCLTQSQCVRVCREDKQTWLIMNTSCLSSPGVIALFCRQYDIIKDNEPNNNKDKAKNSSECSTPEHPTGGLLRSKV